MFKKESLEILKQRINLVEVLEPYLELKASGSTYKGLCPFHDEKTPSFTVQKGDGCYHCFGCGAHGDAIEFLMNHQQMSFSEAVENLAARYSVHLEKVEGEEKGPNKKRLQEALYQAAAYYHSILLNTQEGQEALAYLAKRGVDQEFIKRFMIGYAPKRSSLTALLKEKGFDDQVLLDCALLRKVNNSIFDFFGERITFPIHNAQGAVVGFSARKIREEVYGGKYINTPETAVFKKSHILFGLHECRKRIAKEKQAIIVEGQLDTLRLIYEGMDFVVAGQGTAFGEGHAEQLHNLGVQTLYLAFDSDAAGLAAAEKVGHIFQKKGMEVFVVPIPVGADPDSYVQKKGIKAFEKLMERRVDYLTFLVKMAQKTQNMLSPAVKNAFAMQVSKQIRSWDNEVMVHESLRKLSLLLEVPQEMLGVGHKVISNTYIKHSDTAGLLDIDPDLILESDCLRWMVKMGESQRYLMDWIRLNLKPSHFRNKAAKEIFELILTSQDKSSRLDLHMSLQTDGAQKLLLDIDSKWINLEQAQVGVQDTIQKILEREWMHQREAIRMQILSGSCSDDEAMGLMKQLEQIKNQKPVVRKP